ncbi:dimethyl sulfoxide reductase anchor subunit [Budviciaceae bacterium BWR-B9]|uniref:Dimethyl sulfoxide reductase anchor subunit n=1 Tax=Limnobaculum allomyrinae TaxID=2791986 RepID=A0ABS1IMR7_9GAMM|nr:MULTISPECIES: DmsC/YnfH family molybdoenzyme membrane anchor subunit [Limnobaculum]MBK5142969.1 dimethyl sulfoxide reductase anchor subunit [Limnobaculum allomyrinae]MBV7693298.1 dimethyl sulfoxide reductase anchor subunit [Limnobaculum sp. M2-1]
MHEWPLILFTLLTQAAVGATLFSALYACWINHESGVSVGYYIIKPVLMIICLMAAIGLLCSVAHLGYPMNAFNSLRHAATSWLSREIIFTGVFFGVICLITLRTLMTRRVSRTLLALAALLGIIDIYCMGEVYRHTQIVTWAHLNTQFTFIGTLITLGACIATLLITLRSKGKVSDKLLFKMVCVAVLLTGISLVGRLLVLPDYLDEIQRLSMNGMVTFPYDATTLFNHSPLLRWGAWVAALSGLLVMLFALYFGRQKVIFRQPLMLVSGCILVILAEIIFRYAFFLIS